MACPTSPVSFAVKAVLTDIIGTTTPFSFLSQTIHGLMRSELSQMLDVQWNIPDVQSCVRSILQGRNELPEGAVDDPDVILDKHFHARVAEISKDEMSSGTESPALKRLQGIFLDDFYADGKLKGIVFDDVADAFRRWKTSHLGLLIYSSGSMASQRLLFQNATSGPLDQYIDAYFDTSVGSKREPASYTAICREMSLEPQSVVFIADMIEEVEAAHAAGLRVVIADRPGNLPLDLDRCQIAPVVSTFDQLNFTLCEADD